MAPSGCGSQGRIMRGYEEAPLTTTYKSDIEIAQEATLKPIVDVAKDIGLSEDDIDLYGKYKAKIHLDVLDRYADKPNDKLMWETRLSPGGRAVHGRRGAVWISEATSR